MPAKRAACLLSPPPCLVCLRASLSQGWPTLSLVQKRLTHGRSPGSRSCCEGRSESRRSPGSGPTSSPPPPAPPFQTPGPGRGGCWHARTSRRASRRGLSQCWLRLGGREPSRSCKPAAPERSLGKKRVGRRNSGSPTPSNSRPPPATPSSLCTSCCSAPPCLHSAGRRAGPSTRVKKPQFSACSLGWKGETVEWQARGVGRAAASPPQSSMEGWAACMPAASITRGGLQEHSPCKV